MTSKKIGIIDDEVELAQTMHEFLVGSGFDVKYYTEVKSLISEVDKENFTVIFSDLKMPDKSGLDLLDAIKSMPLKEFPKFVLMSGHIDPHDVKGYYNRGVDEVICKPFDLNDITTVANLYLENGSIESTNEFKFFPVPIKEFINSSANKYDVYLKIDNKYICLAQKGQPLTQLRLEQLVKRGLDHIFLNKADFLKYSDMQVLLTDPTTVSRFELEKRKRLVSHLIEVVANANFISDTKNEFIQKAVHNFENFSHTLVFEEKIFDILSRMKNQDGASLMERSALQGVLAAAVANCCGWSSPKIQSRLLMAGLLCDVGLREIPDVLRKSRVDFETKDIRDFESHPDRSAKILESIPKIPAEVIMVARQHHENEIGTGFPFKLKKEQLHAFSRIVHVVSDFLDLVMGQKDSSNLSEILNVMLDQKVIYSHQILKAMFIVLNVPVPERLAQLQMPDKTGLLT